MKVILLTFATIVCIALIAVFVRQEAAATQAKSLEAPLEELIVADLPGWSSEDKELTDYEGDILNFEDAVFRTYTRGDHEVAIYVAYWKPDQMPIRSVQSHTPDVCWVRNGAELENNYYSVPLSSGPTELHPPEYRTFEMNAPDPVHVYYWHIVGDTLYVNRTDAGEFDRLDPIKTLFKFGLDQKREQFFVRISSNKAFGNLFKEDPGMAQLLRNLAELTLAKPDPELQITGQG
ncbi:MAG: exosortase-associated EpsI family protein [Verrucomicrobiota bacterium]